jgi:hypothetical protein
MAAKKKAPAKKAPAKKVPSPPKRKGSYQNNPNVQERYYTSDGGNTGYMQRYVPENTNAKGYVPSAGRGGGPKWMEDEYKKKLQGLPGALAKRKKKK